jgi:pentatricopeptide repeat protein
VSELAEKGQDVITPNISPEVGTSDMMYSEQISSLCTQRKYKEAMKLFQQAEQKGVSLSKYTYIKLMDGLLKRRKSISKAAR